MEHLHCHAVWVNTHGETGFSNELLPSVLRIWKSRVEMAAHKILIGLGTVLSTKG